MTEEEVEQADKDYTDLQRTKNLCKVWFFGKEEKQAVCNTAFEKTLIGEFTVDDYIDEICQKFKRNKRFLRILGEKSTQEKFQRRFKSYGKSSKNNQA